MRSTARKASVYTTVRRGRPVVISHGKEIGPPITSWDQLIYYNGIITMDEMQRLDLKALGIPTKAHLHKGGAR